MIGVENIVPSASPDSRRAWYQCRRCGRLFTRSLPRHHDALGSLPSVWWFMKAQQSIASSHICVKTESDA